MRILVRRKPAAQALVFENAENIDAPVDFHPTPLFFIASKPIPHFNLPKTVSCITICNTGGVKMLTLRLSSELEEKLNNIAELLGIPKSEVVRKSLQAYLKNLEQNSAWNAGKEMFGKYSSGQTDLSENRKSILKQKLQDKRNAKNSD